MKVGFLENRLRTYGWQWIADYLEEKGCEVYWIVENHYYKPRGKNVYVIPYPSKKDILEAQKTGMLQEIYDYVAFSDRNLNYYGCERADYYFYYYNFIKEKLLKVQPDCVIGECTQFYELLTICFCKLEKILFLHPSSCRYPVDRFSFYKYDTLETYKGSGKEFKYDKALQLANDIANRSTQPSYMIKPPFSLKRWFETQKNKIIYAYSYYTGEHYCTPSIPRKRILVKRRNLIVNKWNELASEKNWEEKIKNKFVVMYPMQMQPEANLDVWGYPYKDQKKTIRLISEQLQADEILIVKPNPKAKFGKQPILTYCK